MSHLLFDPFNDGPLLFGVLCASDRIKPNYTSCRPFTFDSFTLCLLSLVNICKHFQTRSLYVTSVIWMYNPPIYTKLLLCLPLWDHLQRWTTAFLLEHKLHPTAAKTTLADGNLLQCTVSYSSVTCVLIYLTHIIRHTTSHTIFIRSLLLADTKTRTKTTSHQANRM